MEPRAAFGACWGNSTDIVTGTGGSTWMEVGSQVVQFEESFQLFGPLMAFGTVSASFPDFSVAAALLEFTNSKYNSPVISSTFGLDLASLGESVTSCYLGVASSVAALVLSRQLDPSCLSFHAGPRSS